MLLTDPRRLLPLLEGGAAGSLGPADLREVGISGVAVNALELVLSPGFEVIAAAGGLARFTGWDGPIHWVSMAAGGGRRGVQVGRRGRGMPVVLREDGDRLSAWSPIDGSTHNLSSEAVRTGIEALGAVPSPGDTRFWRDHGEPLPNAGSVVTAVPGRAGRGGLYWAGAGWAAIDSVTDASDPGPLLKGCACRTCSTSRRGYLAHLWRQREITAAHLLGWHNLHQARLAVEGDG